MPKFKIVALLTVRNESRYISRCLTHLIEQGINVCLIDNGSSDNTVELAQAFLHKGLLSIEHLPYQGCFELTKILENEQRLSCTIAADWFIHHDADEIRQACGPFKTLKEGIIAADQAGYNAINFNEFVFLPTLEQPELAHTDYVRERRYYYFFHSRSLHRINAWKKQDFEVDLVSSGGHQVHFKGMNIYPENFVLRHYIALDKNHLISKYAGRVFSYQEMVEKGWHGGRALFNAQNIKLPAQSELKELDDSGHWDVSDPWQTHPFLTPANLKRETAQKSHIKEHQDKHGSTLIKKFTRLKNRLFSADTQVLPVPFIVGVMRSGTTLLRLMLDAHPALAIPPETRFFPEIDSLRHNKQLSTDEFMDFITGHYTWDDFQIAAEKLRLCLDNCEPLNLSRALECFYQLYAQGFDKQRWGDKTPYYGTHITDLQELFPQAYFIHIIRDGRDVAVSTKDVWFSLGDNIESVAANWMDRIRQTRQQAQYCRHYLEVRYEDLLHKPEQTLKKICQFIQLPYHSSMLNYHQQASQRLDELASRKDQQGKVMVSSRQRKEIFQFTQQAPDVTRIGRWKTQLNQDEKDTFKQIAGEFLQELGYDL